MPQNYSLAKGSSRGKKLFQPDPKKFIFNVDTLWYTYDALNYDEVMADGLLSKLETGKAFAESEMEKLAYIQVKLDRYDYPVTFEIMPMGQPPLYAFCIRNYDMAFYFSRRRRHDGKTYPVKVQINQFKLWELGVRDAYIESLHVLAELNFAYEAARGNRIDLCVHSDQFDWVLPDIATFKYPRNVQEDNFPNWVKLDPVKQTFETVYFGDRRRLQLRIYNKSKEIKANQKEYFNKLYEERGMNKDKIWNIEFEVHRDYLKGLGNEKTGQTDVFESMDFLLRDDGLSLLWTHLVESKFGHDSAFWKVLQKGDPDKFIQCKNYLFRMKDIDSSIEREIPQLRGRLMKMVLNEEYPEGTDLMVEAFKKFRAMCYEYEEEKEKDFYEDIDRRRKRFMDHEMLKLAMSRKEEDNDPDELFWAMQEMKENAKVEGMKTKTPAKAGEPIDERGKQSN